MVDVEFADVDFSTPAVVVVFGCWWISAFIDNCFDCCLKRLKAKNNANTAFRRPQQMSLVVMLSKPETVWERKTSRQELTLSYWKKRRNTKQLEKVALVNY